jgi:dihydroxyacetone kinase-like predicted kinase
MKVCLKLPIRNLLLDPSDCVLTVTSNLAADVLLNGQGNSGTILSHFFVSLAEAVKMIGKHQLTVDELAACIAATGAMMNDAVPNPVEGTLISVSRDACCGLKKMGSFDTLNHLIQAWEARAQAELAKTPDQLVVDGVRVL